MKPYIPQSQGVYTKQQAKIGIVLLDGQGNDLDAETVEAQILQLLIRDAQHYRDVLQLVMTRGKAIAWAPTDSGTPEAVDASSLHLTLNRTTSDVTDTVFATAVEKVAASIAELLEHSEFSVSYFDVETNKFEFTTP